MIKIRVPASTANLGPGFDTLGIALSLFLTVEFRVGGKSIVINYSGDSAEKVSLDADKNLITQTAMQVAEASGAVLPSMEIWIENSIPLGRGLGSSGSAVVAGIVLANESCHLGFNTQRILDWGLFIEGHPDNITASIMGGFCASFFSSASVTSMPNISPPHNLGRHLSLPISNKLKFVAVIPAFQVPTHEARAVLPLSYSKQDVIFNIQRVACLVNLMSQDNPNPEVFSDAMSDKIHQNYRKQLVPGLQEILELSYKNVPGLLGVCMSGAGPTVLAIAIDNFEEIGSLIQQIFRNNHGIDGNLIDSKCLVLDVVEGASVARQ